MNSFYGNLKNNSRASFIFDKVYPNRYAMEAAVLAGTDGVWVNRYVLVAYNYLFEDGKPPLVTNLSRYGFGGYVGDDPVDNLTYSENPFFTQNREIDVQHYGAGYDKTVWMKIYSNNVEKYIQVGALNAAAPAFELIVDAPGSEDGRPHFDYYHSSELNYSYHMPKNWDIIMNHYSGEATDYTEDGIENADDYYYQDLIEENSTRQYPYVNSKGFDAKHRYYDVETEDNILFTNVSSGIEYPGHEYVKIHLTYDTYVPNLYYHKVNGIWKIADEEEFIPQEKDAYDPEKEYYTKAQGKYEKVSNSEDFVYILNKYYIKDGDEYVLATSPSAESGIDYYEYQNVKVTSVLDDTKRLDVELPSVGNAISDVYDSIYGRPLNPDYPNGIKYIADSVDGYSDFYPNGYNNINYPNQCSIKGMYYFLSDSEWDALSDEYSDETPIPVYNIANDGDRPYTLELLYNFLNIEPYNNITPNDPVSMAWGVEELKKYISELRYLSHGEVDGNYDTLAYNGNGLLANWELDDKSAFGYIYNKPTVITYYKQVTEPTPITPEMTNDYYYIRDIDDDKHVPYYVEGQITGGSHAVSFTYDVYETINGEKVLTTTSLSLTRKDPNIQNPDLLNNFTQDIYEVADVTTHYSFEDNDKYSLVNNADFNTYRLMVRGAPLIYKFTEGNYLPVNILHIPLGENDPYLQNKYYYIDGDNYVLSTATTPEENVTYYSIVPIFRSDYFYIKEEEVSDLNEPFKFGAGNITPISTTIDEETYYTYNTKGILIAENGIDFNTPYLGFNGKIVSYIVVKELFPTDSILINELNKPGGYDQYVYKIVFAKNLDGQGIMDTTVNRDGRFHIYINIREYETGLPIEKIWQRIPVEDIMEETAIDTKDTSDVIGDYSVQIAESVEILDSPISLLLNNVTYIANRTTNIEKFVGNVGINSTTDTTLAARMVAVESSITAINAVATSQASAIAINAGDISDINSSITAINRDIANILASLGLEDEEETINDRINALEDLVGSDDEAIDTLSNRMNNIETIAGVVASHTSAIAALDEFVGTSASMTASYLEDDTLADIVENLYLEIHPIESEP